MNIKKHLKKLIVGLALVSAFVVATPLTSKADDVYFSTGFYPVYYSYPTYHYYGYDSFWSPALSFGFVIR